MSARVLIVEDESIVALDLAGRLAGLGFTVVGQARSGEDALRLAREHSPDVILMDIQIKGEMDGIETAGCVRRELGIPSIFLTAYSDSESIDRAKRSEAYGYLLKPFQEREVVIAIELALYKHSAEREILRNRRLLGTTLNSIGEGVITTDSSERILLLNESAERLTGWSSEEVVGMPLSDVFQTEAVVGGDDTGAVDENRSILTARSGVRVPVEVITRSLSPETPGDASAVVVFRDISESLRYERSLVQAKEAAESAVRAKSDFLARVSHELRTPLNSIIGMAQLAEDAVVPPEVSEYLVILRSSADSLMALISDLLDYAKFERGRITIRRDIFSVPELVETITRAHAMDAHARGLRLSTVVSPDIPASVYGDERRVNQIIGNLLSNAIKFTNTGSVQLLVELSGASDLQSSAERETTLVFTVQDTGIGIPVERQDAIFEEFSQLDDPATRTAGGTGLGLAIVWRLVDAMHGAINVESVPGEGTRFTAEIPLAIADDQSILDRLRSDLPSRRGATSSAGRILVDDSLLFRALSPWVTACAGAGEAQEPSRLRPIEGERINPQDIVVLPAVGYDGFMQRHAAGGQSADEGAVPTVVVTEAFSSSRGPGGHSDTGASVVRLKEPLKLSDYYAIATGNFETFLHDEISSTEDSQTTAETVPSGVSSVPVLAVDDDPVNLMIVKRLLERSGYTVLAVNDGGAAIEVLRDTSVSAICIDIEMPTMDGWELAKRIRRGDAGKRGAQIPLIAVTGHNKEAIKDKVMEHDFSCVLTKPFAGSELYVALERALNGKTTETAHATSSCRADTATIIHAIETGNLDSAREIVRKIRERSSDPGVTELAFRMQLALRRGDTDTVLRLVTILKEKMEA